MGLRSLLGNITDYTGSAFNLPDLGLSELIAGGNTANSNVGAAPYQRKAVAASPSFVGRAIVGGPQAQRTTPAAPGPIQGPAYTNPRASIPRATTTTSSLALRDGGGTEGGEGGFQPQVFNGQLYNNEADLFAAQQAYYDQLYGERAAEIGQQRTSLRDQILRLFGAEDVDNVSLDTVGGDLGTSRDRFNREITDATGELTRGRDKATRNIDTSFSNLGGIRQSSQGVVQNESDAEFDRAGTNLQEQAATGRSSLQRALEDAITGVRTNKSALDSAETDLARNYREDRDQLSNSLLGLISNLTGSVDPSVTRSEVSGQQSLLDQLQALRTRQLNPAFAGGGGNSENETSAILQFLLRGGLA